MSAGDVLASRAEIKKRPDSQQGTSPAAKFELAQLNAWVRASCKQPLPTCGQVCGRTLDCGLHTCAERCHDSLCTLQQ